MPVEREQDALLREDYGGPRIHLRRRLLLVHHKKYPEDSAAAENEQSERGEEYPECPAGTLLCPRSFFRAGAFSRTAVFLERDGLYERDFLIVDDPLEIVFERMHGADVARISHHRIPADSGSRRLCHLCGSIRLRFRYGRCFSERSRRSFSEGGTRDACIEFFRFSRDFFLTRKGDVPPFEQFDGRKYLRDVGAKCGIFCGCRYRFACRRGCRLNKYRW